MNSTEVTIAIKGIGPFAPIPDPHCFTPNEWTAIGTVGGGFTSFAINQLIASYCPYKPSRFSNALPSDTLWYMANSVVSFVFGGAASFLGLYGYQYSQCKETHSINEELKGAVVKQSGEKAESCDFRERICWVRERNQMENIDRFVTLSSIAQKINQV